MKVDGHLYDIWAAEVELVDEPAEASEPAPPTSAFARHVDEAKKLLDGTAHTGADVVNLARELAVGK
ncbi:hypothetical protein M2271_003595 [Streptomyces sp. LBL]|uniref:hypothetical protein n=1 Tax=Streptomyces sp. LBL TaxID=2940562 RepID=UPI002474E2DD|nr:hypothetical protein [Streptomyces sp. LBL]MDH6625784.1 hypothetical protein [Streptomyces sp. LBL]